MRYIAVLLLIIVVSCYTYVFAEVPPIINYQGKLTKASGEPLDTTIQMVFNIYPDSTGATPLWTETQSAVKVEKGVFNVLLGSVNSIPYAVFEGSVRYLGVQVGGDPEIIPRKPMVSVAYAIRSGSGGAGTDNDWIYQVSDGADTTLITGGAWGIARYGNILFGNGDSTHVNLGVACTTGTNGQNYKYCTVVGGMGNTATGDRATIGGGSSNRAAEDDATVVGGWGNAATGENSAVTGGCLNTASGWAATVPGGYMNTAGEAFSFAAGRRAKAEHPGSFVWADDTNEDFASTDTNQFLIRASGGVGIGTNSPSATLDVAGRVQMTGFKMTTGAMNGFVFTSNDSGVGTWQPTASGTDSDWVFRITDTADTTLITGGAWGIARYGNTLYGNSDHTHVNLGVACTTGTSGENYPYCTVAGGRENTASGQYATVGGGWFNTASKGLATVGGGYANSAGGYYATAAGGKANDASGDYSTVPGGYYNTADGAYSFAAGYRAKANHAGSFVWADTTGGDFASTAENQFLIRATGGFGMYNSSNTQVVKLQTTETGSDGSLLSMYEADGTKTVHIDAEGATYGGAQLSLEDHDGTTTISLDAESGASNGGAFMSMYDGVGTMTIHMDANGADGGAQVSLIDHDSTTTISLDAESGVNGGAIMKLLTGDGVATIKLDADYNATGEGRVITSVLEITGGSDLSEQFEIRTDRDNLVASPGMVVCIDSKRPGELVVSSKAYDPTVAGIISGAGGIKPGLLMSQAGSISNGKHAVALTGRVYCWADASSNPIRPGDLLTTSDTPGHAMKVEDYARAQGAIIGKAMSSLGQGQGLVLVLVSLQ